MWRSSSCWSLTRSLTLSLSHSLTLSLFLTHSLTRSLTLSHSWLEHVELAAVEGHVRVSASVVWVSGLLFDGEVDVAEFFVLVLEPVHHHAPEPLPSPRTSQNTSIYSIACVLSVKRCVFG